MQSVLSIWIKFRHYRNLNGGDDIDEYLLETKKYNLSCEVLVI